MMPGNLNPKQMKQMMKKLGMDVKPIEDVQSIVISTPSGRYVFDTAEVTAMTMQGVTTYQIVGSPRFEDAAPVIPEEDIVLVSEQAGVTVDEARSALEETRGDIADAILRLAK
jgi:nascent polypeptide-associated complex subunit alpha